MNFEITIDELGVRGDGIGRLPDGRRCFVPGALPGEVVRVSLARERAGGVADQLTKILKKSANRIDPPCVYFGKCGGCALQHMKAEIYTAFKVNRVKTAMVQAGLPPDVIKGIHTSPPGTRRRAVLSAKCGADGIVEVGFNERASHRLVMIESCAVLTPALVDKLSSFRRFLPEIMQPGESYDLALTEVMGRVEALITVLGTAQKRLYPQAKEVLAQLAEHADLARLYWRENGLSEPQTVIHRAEFTAGFEKFKVALPPGAFLQATEAGQKTLTETVAKWAKKSRHLADLYAGCGTFSLSLLAQGHSVDAFEGDRAAIEALAQAGKGQARLKTARRDLAREPLTFQELKAYDTVVMDPPRVGAKEQAAELTRSAVPCVIGVSCNPSTFARDGAILCAGGYRLKEVQIVDQFLWSPHVELAGLFVRE